MRKLGSDEKTMDRILGTVYAISEAGTRIRCYSHLRLNPKPDKYIYIMDGTPNWQQVVEIEFEHLARRDKIFLNKWEDFTIYDIHEYHHFIDTLEKKCGFTLWCKD
jgi:hypothetical protein